MQESAVPPSFADNTPTGPDDIDRRMILLARTETAVQEINAAQQALSALEQDHPLVKRVKGRLDRSFDSTREELLNLARDERAVVDVADQAPLTEHWSRFWALHEELRPVHQETLAFIEGLLVRRQKLDGGICDLADGLLRELSTRCGVPWDRFTILAEGELFSELAGVVRLRFPKLDIWDLPIAAHEFGHMAGPSLETRSAYKPFAGLVQAQRLEIDVPDGGDYDAYLHEYFADIFATYTLGPSYAAACLLLRFPLGKAREGGARHPAPIERAYVILQALERLDVPPTVTKPFASVARRLHTEWSAALAATGVDPNLTDATRERLDQLELELSKLLDNTLEPDARYRPGAWRLAEDFRDALATPNAPLPSDDRATCADVLNGAWLFRLTPFERDMESLRSAARRAREQCGAIIREQERA